MDAVTMPESRLQDLVERAQCGDREAFDELAGEYRDRLRAAIQSWSRFQIGRRIDPGDVVQETLVRAHQSLARFEWRGDDSFFHWLKGVAKNALARLADEARRVGPSLVDDLSPGRDPSAAQVLRRDERFDRLEAALTKLSPDHRRVIRLSRLEGLPSQVVAERMGRSPAAVRQLLVRALRELREEFGDTASLHLPDRELDLGEDSDDR